MTSETVILLVDIVIGGFAGFLAATFKMGEYTQKINYLENRVAELEKDHKTFSKDLTECSTKIDERTSAGSSSLTKRKSPISLNEKGEDILKRSGSDKFVLENQKELVQKIKEKNPTTAYDVQEYARTVVESLQNEQRFIPFKDFVYKEGFPLSHIFTVMSLYLRDIAIPLLGFTLEQVDQTDPARKNVQTPKQ